MRMFFGAVFNAGLWSLNTFTRTGCMWYRMTAAVLLVLLRVVEVRRGEPCEEYVLFHEEMMAKQRGCYIRAEESISTAS